MTGKAGSEFIWEGTGQNPPGMRELVPRKYREIHVHRVNGWATFVLLMGDGIHFYEIRGGELRKMVGHPKWGRITELPGCVCVCVFNL